MPCMTSPLKENCFTLYLSDEIRLSSILFPNRKMFTSAILKIAWPLYTTAATSLSPANWMINNKKAAHHTLNASYAALIVIYHWSQYIFDIVASCSFLTFAFRQGTAATWLSYDQLSCFADWSKCRHVTLIIIKWSTRHGRPCIIIMRRRMKACSLPCIVCIMNDYFNCQHRYNTVKQ